MLEDTALRGSEAKVEGKTPVPHSTPHVSSGSANGARPSQSLLRRFSSAHYRLYRKFSATSPEQLSSDNSPLTPSVVAAKATPAQMKTAFQSNTEGGDSESHRKSPLFAPLAAYSTWRGKLRARGLRQIEEGASRKVQCPDPPSTLTDNGNADEARYASKDAGVLAEQATGEMQQP